MASGASFMMLLVRRVFYAAARGGRHAMWRARLEHLGAGTTISPYVVIHRPEKVRIGSRVNLVEFVHILGGGRGGEEVMKRSYAAHSAITTVTHDANARVYRDTPIRRPIRIRNRVWVGSHAVIVPGVAIGDGAIVGAGSVVTRDVAPNTIVTGVPSRPLRKINRGDD